VALIQTWGDCYFVRDTEGRRIAWLSDYMWRPEQLESLADALEVPLTPGKFSMSWPRPRRNLVTAASVVILALLGLFGFGLVSVAVDHQRPLRSERFVLALLLWGALTVVAGRWTVRRFRSDT
jgi:hypothetical protein